ncbi:MAG: hypothetical protein FJ150_09905 [Euryarchaeota archaeon]|nr:hypothetical protein [Euryarchaeota archaeon]
MKQSQFVIIIIACAVVLVSAYAVLTIGPSESNIKHFEGNGISIDYPADYYLKEVKSDVGRFIEAETDSGSTFEISKIVVNNSFENYQETLKELLTPNYTILKEENITVNGVPAYKISYSLNETKEMTILIVFEKNDIRYSIIFTSKGEVKDSDVQTVVNSFRVI